jgi:hypothetical protein
MRDAKRARERAEENLNAFATTFLSWWIGGAVGKEMKEDQRAHIDIDVRRHIV